MVRHSLYLVLVNMVVVVVVEAAQPSSAEESAGKLKGKSKLNKLWTILIVQLKKMFLWRKTIPLKKNPRRMK